MDKIDKIKIVVDDPVVQELLPGYLNRREQEVLTLLRLLDDNEFEKIRIIGHNLKGSGGLYGVDLISEFGHQIETAALAANAEQLNESIQNYKSYISKIDFERS